jgi:hypothetical protein
VTKEPLDHIARPQFPWSDPADGLTECGRPLADVVSVKTRSEIAAKIKRDGQARAAYTTCMTCAQTSERNVPWLEVGQRLPVDWGWNDDPVAVMRRAVAPVWSPKQDSVDRLRRELTAIGMLVMAHRDEFDGLVEGLAEAVPIDEMTRRRARRGR